MARNFKSDKSGQIIIVTALLVSVLLLSTALYVIEVGKQVPTVDRNQNTVFSGYRQATTSTLISALANATDGGDPDVLNTDLSQFKTIILSNSYQALLTMNYEPQNTGGYQKGLKVNWRSDGEGTSSACVSFSFASSAPTTTSNQAYMLNVSSSVNLSGGYHQTDDNSKQVNLTFNFKNEDKPALTRNFTVSYQNVTDWIQVAPASTTDFGNGTYALTFNADSPLGASLVVSLLCQDQRGIFVGANLTCTST
jgi:hypothetical protein